MDFSLKSGASSKAGIKENICGVTTLIAQNKSVSLSFGAAIAITMLVLVIDLFTAPKFALGVLPYFVAVALSCRTGSPRELWIVCGVSVLCVAAGYLVKAPNYEIDQFFINRSSVVGLLFITAIVCAKANVDSSRRIANLTNAMVENFPGIVVIKDAELRYQIVNSNFLKMIGQSHEEAIGYRLRDFLTDPEVDKIEASDRWVFDNARSLTTERRAERPDGERFDFIEVKFPIFENEDEVTAVGSIVLDITEKKHLLDFYNKQEERFRQIFENVSTGFIVVSPHGEIEMFNSAAEKLFGYSSDELIGQNVSSILPLGSRAEIHEALATSVKSTRTADQAGVANEIGGIRKDGTSIALQIGVGQMTLREKPAFIFSVTDVSRVKSLEQKLYSAQRLESLGQLTGGVAHDFNNVMATILGNTELLSDIHQSDKDTQQLTAAILRAIDRGTALTSRLLAFSSNQPLVPKSINTAHLIRQMQDVMRLTLGDNVSFNIHAQTDLWNAYIDPLQLENAIINLLINARDAMPGGGSVSIHLRNHAKEEAADNGTYEFVLIEICDTGEGISEDNLSRVFEPFFTTKEFGRGSGLGLSMVYGFIRQSNGEVNLGSEFAVGTSVQMLLPRSVLPIEPEFKMPPALSIIQDRHLLVVEDDDDVRSAVVRILRNQGYNVLEAVDGTEALSLLRNETRVDLLLTDVSLPGGMSGVSLAKKAVELRPDLAVVYATGFSECAFEREGIDSKSVPFLSKPYRRSEVLEVIETLLSQK